MVNQNNPFYRNYVFSEFDTKRGTFDKWDWVWLWIYPTYVQCSEGYAFHYKITRSGRIYIIKFEKTDDSPNK